jgi:large subunit ribosomal protein L25
MLQVEMSASVRTASGKGPMRQLRMKGMTPAVVYGGGAEALMLQLDSKTLMAQLLYFYRRNAVVTLKIDGAGEKNVVVGEVQTDPVRDTLVHVDFCEIDLNRERPFNVPIIYQGIAKGVDLGGVLNVIHNDVVIEGKPLEVPDEFVVDVTRMAMGDQITCGSIGIPDNVRMVTDPASIAVSVIRPGVEEEEEVEEEEGEEETQEQESPEDQAE